MHVLRRAAVGLTLAVLADGSYRLTHDRAGKAVIGYFEVAGGDLSLDFPLPLR